MENLSERWIFSLASSANWFETLIDSCTSDLFPQKKVRVFSEGKRKKKKKKKNWSTNSKRLLCGLKTTPLYFMTSTDSSETKVEGSVFRPIPFLPLSRRSVSTPFPKRLRAFLHFSTLSSFLSLSLSFSHTQKPIDRGRYFLRQHVPPPSLSCHLSIIVFPSRAEIQTNELAARDYPPFISLEVLQALPFFHPSFS